MRYAGGLDEFRVAEVYAETATGVSSGSGYLVGPRLVLTSGHVVRPLVRLWVRLRRDDRLLACRLTWHRHEDADAGVDAALLEITDERWTPREHHLRPVRWGYGIGYGTNSQCVAAGFPAVLTIPDGTRDVEIAEGSVIFGSRAKARRHDMKVEHAPAALRAGSAWAGMSGAAVLSGPTLLGVVATDAAGFDSDRLTLVPVAELFAVADFRAAIDATAVLEPVELVSLTEPPVSQARASSPAHLLRTEAAVVPFHPRPEHVQLVDWCTEVGPFGGGGVSVRLIVGPGGQGKTRLADEVARNLRNTGWAACRIADPQQAPVLPPVASTALASRTVPLLLVIDNADTRPEQVGVIVEAALAGGSDHPVRILLLARTSGDWWRLLADGLSADAQAVLDAAEIMALPDLTPTRLAYLTVFRSAVGSFADALSRMPGYSDTDWRALAGTIAAPMLAENPHAIILDVHMAAMAELLRGTNQEESAVEVLLRHERLLWTRTARVRSITLSDTALHHAVAAAALCGADSADSAARTLRHVIAVRDQSEDTRLAVGRWLADLYPGTGYWGAPGPDAVAEHIVARVVEGNGDFLSALLPNVEERSAFQALTLLDRASVDRPPVERRLTDVLATFPGQLSTAGIVAAVRAQNPAPFAAAFEAIADGEHPVELLEQINRTIPSHSWLSSAARRIAERVVSDRRQQGDPAAVVDSMVTLARRLSDQGRNEDALRVSTDAVHEALDLTAQERSVRTLTLAARTLESAASVFSAIGAYPQARETAEDAISALRDAMAMDRPGEHVADFLRLNGNAATYASLMGDMDAATADLRKAVELQRSLVDINRTRFLPQLADSLHNLAVATSVSGPLEAALTFAKEAVEYYRELAEASPVSFGTKLVGALGVVTNLSMDLRLLPDALAAAEDAVRLARTRAGRLPPAEMVLLARALDRLGVVYAISQNMDQAVETFTEAVDVYHLLDPDRAHTGFSEERIPSGRSPFVEALWNLSMAEWDTGLREESMRRLSEACDLLMDRLEAVPAAPAETWIQLGEVASELADRLYASGHTDAAPSYQRIAKGARERAQELASVDSQPPDR